MIAILAAAHAEVGNFDDAIKWQAEAEKTLEDAVNDPGTERDDSIFAVFEDKVATKKMQSRLLQAIKGRLDRYRNNQPCRELLPDVFELTESEPESVSDGP